LLAFNANVNANKKTHEIWAKNDVGGIFGRFVKIAPNVVMTSKFTKKYLKLGRHLFILDKNICPKTKIPRFLFSFF